MYFNQTYDFIKLLEISVNKFIKYLSATCFPYEPSRKKRNEGSEKSFLKKESAEKNARVHPEMGLGYRSTLSPG